jgi:hypothetical protein
LLGRVVINVHVQVGKIYRGVNFLIWVESSMFMLCMYSRADVGQAKIPDCQFVMCLSR